VKKVFTCLLIDDDTDDQEIFMSVMEQIAPGARCITATNGYEAIRKLSSPDVKPDVIFVDLNMPMMNGKRFLEERRSIDGLQNVPVIILTTTSDRKSKDETSGLGAAGYITKPDTISGWKTIIKENIDALGWATDAND
jgi:CheY-like chemotaxis protein